MENIFEQWRNFQSDHESRQKVVEIYLQDPEFLKEVMGIQVPLNESYPYSLATTQSLSDKILQEQLLLEGWFQDGWELIKKMSGEVKDFFVSLWNVIKGGKLGLYWRGLKRAGLETIQGKLQKVFNIIIAQRGKYPGSEQMADWAESLSNKVDTASKRLLGAAGINEIELAPPTPPPSAQKVFGGTLLLVGLRFLWNKLKDWAEPLLRTELGRTINLLKNIAIKYTKLGLAKAGEFMARIAGAKATAGASELYIWLQKIAKFAGEGLQAAMEILVPALAFYNKRGGNVRNESLDPDIIKTIEESTLSVLELPISNMYMDGKHITVQLNTDSREHAPEFTRLVQNRWAHSSECLKLEKMGYKVYISTKDKETPGFLLTKQLI